MQFWLPAVSSAGQPIYVPLPPPIHPIHAFRPVLLPYWWHCCWLHHDPGSMGRNMFIYFSVSFDTISPGDTHVLVTPTIYNLLQPQSRTDAQRCSCLQRLGQRVNWWGNKQRARRWSSLCFGDAGLLWEKRWKELEDLGSKTGLGETGSELCLAIWCE